jgi:ABC-type multidrug transport system ATPase subunit
VTIIITTHYLAEAQELCDETKSLEKALSETERQIVVKEIFIANIFVNNSRP